ncbi:hypothetical protein ABTZ93_36245 [Streptomyces sp. NPDC097941]|uniref:LptM family lipoprotein n=1 Tax=Streptomyces sp. NPDC097941 TaxID=3155685 RepID=UPI00332F9439
MRRAVIPVLIMSCVALLAGCGRGEIDAKGDIPHNAASGAKSTPTQPPSAEPFLGTGDLVEKSVGNAAKHADRSGFSLAFMTYAHGDGLAEAGYEINIYTYNEDHKVSSVTDLSSIARHSNSLVCRAKKTGPKSYAIYFDKTYDLCLRKGKPKSTPTPTHSPEPIHTLPESASTYVPPKPAGCAPKSPAGNCYQAGQYCPNALGGTSGTNSSGTVIYCRLDSTDNRWHWRY